MHQVGFNYTDVSRRSVKKKGGGGREREREIAEIQGAAERTPLFEKRINSKPKKICQMFFYFWKGHRMPFYINVF